MPKISKNASVTLSLICCIVGFLGLIGLAVFLPVGLPKGNGGPYDGQFIGQMLPMSYLMLVPVTVANGFLMKLLLLVKKHLVFTDKAPVMAESKIQDTARHSADQVGCGQRSERIHFLRN